MKATFRIVTPAAASAVAAILLSACADKPVHVPGGVFVEEPYTGESVSGAQTQPQTQPEAQTIPAGNETYETEIIFIEEDVPVGPVEGGSQAGQQVQPIEQESASKVNAPEGSVEYKVVKGDTLWGIGMVYGVSVARLAEINGIDEKAPLKIGQVLMIPPDAKNAVGKPIPQKKTEPAKTSTSTTKASTTTTKSSVASTAKPVAKDGETLYVVKKGDSLSVIAQRHHVKLADLVAANKIDQNGILRIGQTLVIPAAGSKAASTSTTAKSSSTASTATKTEPAKTDTKAASTSAATTTKTEPAKTDTKPAASSSQMKGGEGTGGVVEPIGGSSSGVSSTPAAQTSVSTSAPALDPVSAIPDTDVISIPIDFESTLEELSGILERDLNDLVRLNPEFKPGQKIPAGTAVKMPLF